MIRLEIKKYNVFSIEKQQQYQHYRQLQMINMNIFEHLTGKEILQSDQSQILEQTKLTYTPLGKALEKQTKTIEDEAKKLITIEDRTDKQILNTDQK